MEVDVEIAYQLRAMDSYAWHRRLWECFPGHPEAERDFLTRVDELEGEFRLWILSEREPYCPTWCPEIAFNKKGYTPVFPAGSRFHFDLKANPTKCVSKPDSHGRMPRHGNRVPLIKEKDLEDWLIRKGSTGGFSLVPGCALDIGPAVQHHFRHKERVGYHSGVRYRGTLEVTDKEKFRQNYNKGIGGAKGFGFGLLLLAPAQSYLQG
jgi:CRISPR system Cascade subunit CasE